MKRFLVSLFSLLLCVIAYADTINLHWLNHDGTNYTNTTCVVNSDLILPSTPPTRYGYTFTGWKITNYTPLEYIESTETQWIDTGIKQSLYTGNLIVNATFQYNVATANKWLMGVSATTYFMPLLIRGGYFVSNIGTGGTDINTQAADTNKHSMICDSVNKIITIDGTQYAYTSNAANIAKNIYLFGLNNNGSAYGLANLKIYKTSFSTGDGNLIRDFIPVLDENNVPCMYDKVEDKFYYNQGTGQFVAGPILQ